MKTWNVISNQDGQDIVHLWGDRDLYDVTESGGKLTYTSNSLQRTYVVDGSESLYFKQKDGQGKAKYNYISELNLYGIRKSCLEILENNPGAQSGLYMVKPDGVNEQQVYCDMTEGWTLTFSYDTSDHNTVDETAFPSIAGSRDKLLSKVWGMTDNLHGTGHTIGNITPLFKDYIVNGSTEVKAQVVRVDNNDQIRAERFQVQDKDFIDRVHNGNQMDCWTSMDGGSRLIIANYTSPSYTYNRTLKAGCGGSANTQSVSNSNMIASGNWGIDGALIFSDEGNNGYGDATKDLTIHVNWYGDRGSQDLYNHSTTNTQSKWGTSATWYSDIYGRSGDTPGPMICSSECGYTNNSQNVFKMRLWIK
jgi:hypothetical protein